MVRKLQRKDIDEVTGIWLDVNLKAHDFIPDRYWKDNYKLVQEMLGQAEVYVYEEENERDMEMIKRELKAFLAQTTNIDGRAIKQDALQLGALINQKIFIDSYRYKKGEESG